MYPAGRFLAAVVAASLISLAPPAVAHGGSGHGEAKTKAVDYATTEATPFGRAGSPKRVDRTIRIEMEDTMHFFAVASAQRPHITDVRPDQARRGMSGDIVLNKGETVRFIVRNDGKVMHEMVIGSMKELQAHAEMMRRFPGMEHDELYMAHVEPGKQGEIVWQFIEAGEFHYACLIPGHMEAGMIAKITVK